MLNKIRININKWKEQGSLPLVLIAVMLIASTGVLLTMLSISQTKATEQNITNTNLTSAFVSCKAYLTAELGKAYAEIPDELTPHQTPSGMEYPEPEQCDYNNTNTKVRILSASLYPNATNPTQVKFTLQATYQGFTTNTKTETHYISLPEALPVGLIEEDWQIVGFDDAGHAIWGPTASELGAPVKTRQPIIKWDETTWDSWGFNMDDLNDPTKGPVCANPALLPEYSWRAKMQGQTAFPEWSNWTKTAPTNETITGWNTGLQHTVQVKTRCVTHTGNAARENVGAEQIKLRPMLPPVAPASIQWSASANYGLTWTASSCATNPGATLSYSWRWYDGNTWTNWSTRTTATTISNPNNAAALLQEGQFGQAEVKAVCFNPVSETYSPESTATSTGPFFRPISAPPAPATLTFSAPNFGLTWTNPSGTICGVGTAQYQFRVNKNDTWGAWSAWQTALTTNTNFLNYGETGTAEVRTRCFINNDNLSNSSVIRSSGSYTRVPNPPAAPTNPRWSGPTTVAWDAVTCVAGTSPQYRFSTQQNTNNWSSFSTWQATTTATSNALNPGDHGKVRVNARCVVGSTASEASGTTTSPEYTRPNTPPSTALTATWTSVDEAALTFNNPTCATGSSLEATYRVKTLTTGNFQTNPAIGTYPTTWLTVPSGSTTSSLVNEGYPARAQAKARCVNTTTNVASDYSNEIETPWVFRTLNWEQGPSHNHNVNCAQGNGSCTGTGKHTVAQVTCPAGSRLVVRAVASTAMNSGSTTTGYTDDYQTITGTYQATGGNPTSRIMVRTRTGSGGQLGSRVWSSSGSPAQRGWGGNWISYARSSCDTPYTRLMTVTSVSGRTYQGGWWAGNSHNARVYDYNGNGAY